MIPRESDLMADLVESASLRRWAPPGGDIDDPHFRLIFRPFEGVVKIQLLASPAGNDPAHRLGVQLPEPCQAIEAGPLLFAWIAPHEWLVIGPEGDVGHFSREAQDSTAGHGLITDITHACAVFELSGPAAREALNTHCPLDLSDRAFPVGRATRSLLADTNLFVSRRQDGARGPAFTLIVDQTMAAYATRMFAASPATASYTALLP
jgi:sarcosine oxidase subunit gamma